MQRSISYNMSSDLTQLHHSDSRGGAVQPATKRAKQSEDDDSISVSNPDESETTSPLFLQALKPIVDSQFKELGRLMVQTSKRFEGEVFDDKTGNQSLWKTLCCMYWGKDDATAVLEAVAPMSEKDCIQKLVLDTAKPSLSNSDAPVAGIQSSPEDYVVIVSLRDPTTDKNIFCKAFKGQDIARFFEHGVDCVRFDQPIWQTKMPPFEPGEFSTGEPNTEVTLKLVGKLAVQLLRRPDQCVGQTTIDFRQKILYVGSLEMAEGEVMIAGYLYRGCFSPTSDYGKEVFRNQKPKYCDHRQKVIGLEVELEPGFCKVSNDVAGLNVLSLRLTYLSSDDESEEGYSDRNFQGGLDLVHFLDAVM